MVRPRPSSTSLPSPIPHSLAPACPTTSGVSLELLTLPSELLEHIAALLPPRALLAFCSSTPLLRSLLATTYFWRKRCHQLQLATPCSSLAPAPAPAAALSAAASPPAAPAVDTTWSDWQAAYVREVALRQAWTAPSRKKLVAQSVVNCQRVVPQYVPAFDVSTDAHRTHLTLATRHTIHHIWRSPAATTTSASPAVQWSGEALHVSELRQGMAAFSASTDVCCFSSGVNWDTLTLVSMQSGSILEKWRSSFERGQRITCSQVRGYRVASGAELCTLWDVETLKRLCRFGAHSHCTTRQVATKVRFTDTLFAASWQKVSKVRDIRTRRPIATFHHHFTATADMEFNDRLLATATDSGVLLWDFRNTTRPRELLTPQRGAAAVTQVLLDDYKVVGLSADSVVQAWNLQDTTQSRVLKKSSPVYKIGMDRSTLYTLGTKVRMYSISELKQQKRRR